MKNKKEFKRLVSNLGLYADNISENFGIWKSKVRDLAAMVKRHEKKLNKIENDLAVALAGIDFHSYRINKVNDLVEDTFPSEVDTNKKNETKDRIFEECRLIGRAVKYGTPEGDDQVYDAVEKHLENIRNLMNKEDK